MILVASNPEIVDDGRRGGSKIHVGSERIAMYTACKSKEASSRIVTYRPDERMSLVLGPF